MLNLLHHAMRECEPFRILRAIAGQNADSPFTHCRPAVAASTAQASRRRLRAADRAAHAATGGPNVDEDRAASTALEPLRDLSIFHGRVR